MAWKPVEMCQGRKSHYQRVFWSCIVHDMYNNISEGNIIGSLDLDLDWIRS